jgi:DNA-binding beta-propeller fold protein YncE
VQVLNYATGEFVRSFRFASKGKSSESQTYPTSVAINRGGSNIAVKFSNGTIQIFQLDGKLLSTFGQQGSGDGQFSGEGHIAYDKNDNLVVSDSDNNRIQVLNSKGIFQRSIGVGDRSGGLKHPVGFTFDESGESDRIIVADCANNRVQVLQYSNGSHIRTIGSSAQLDRPYHVCIDSEKRYVVADSGHGKLQFLT